LSKTYFVKIKSIKTKQVKEKERSLEKKKKFFSLLIFYFDLFYFLYID